MPRHCPKDDTIMEVVVYEGPDGEEMVVRECPTCLHNEDVETDDATVPQR